MKLWICLLVFIFVATARAEVSRAPAPLPGFQSHELILTLNEDHASELSKEPAIANLLQSNSEECIVVTIDREEKSPCQDVSQMLDWENAEDSADLEEELAEWVISCGESQASIEQDATLFCSKKSQPVLPSVAGGAWKISRLQ